jgi:putative transposase
VKGFVRNKAVYVALAVPAHGSKEILGRWIEQTEGATFWLRVMNEPKSRGCQDIPIAVVDGLKGFPETTTAVFPQTIVQTCIVHLIRHTLEFVSNKDRKPVVPALSAICRTRDAEAGLKALEAFEAGYWGQRYPAISQSWRRNWEHVVSFFAFPESVRRIIYTTNAIEALNSKLRRAVRRRGHFPGDEAAVKPLYRVLNNAAEQWKPASRGGSRQRHSSPSTSANGSSTDATGPLHKIPDTPRLHDLSQAALGQTSLDQADRAARSSGGQRSSATSPTTTRLPVCSASICARGTPARSVRSA